MPPPGQENKQGIWVVLRLYRDRLDNTNNWERFYEEAGGMIKVFECNEPSSSTGSKGKRQKMRKTNTKKFTKGRELKLATVAEVRSNSAGKWSVPVVSRVVSRYS